MARGFSFLEGGRKWLNVYLFGGNGRMRGLRGGNGARGDILFWGQNIFLMGMESGEVPSVCVNQGGFGWSLDFILRVERSSIIPYHTIPTKQFKSRIYLPTINNQITYTPRDSYQAKPPPPIYQKYPYKSCNSENPLNSHSHSHSIPKLQSPKNPFPYHAL